MYVVPMQRFFSIYSEKLDILLKHCKSSIKPPKGLFLSIRFYGGLIEKVGGRGANLICGETGYHTAFPNKEKNRWYNYSL